MADYLSEVERDEARIAFDRSDKATSGLISISELRETLRLLRQEPTIEEVVELIAGVDEEGRGEIDFDGFCKLLGGQKLFQRKPREDDSDTLDAFVALVKSQFFFLFFFSVVYLFISFIQPQRLFFKISKFQFFLKGRERGQDWEHQAGEASDGDRDLWTSSERGR